MMVVAADDAGDTVIDGVDRRGEAGAQIDRASAIYRPAVLIAHVIAEGTCFARPMMGW
ncbi:MAG: hypothetical protein ACJ8CR_39225 [Roseiflexaceae bacterium]